MERPSLYFYQLFKQSGASFFINFEDKHNLLVHGVINSLVSHLHYKAAKIHAQNRTLYQNRWYSKNNLNYSPALANLDNETDSLPQAESQDLDLNKLTTGLLYRESRKLKAATSHQPSHSEKQEFYLRSQKLKKELNHFSLCYWGTRYQSFSAWYQATNCHQVIYQHSAQQSYLSTIDLFQANSSKLKLLFTHPKLAQADQEQQDLLQHWLAWQGNQETSIEFSEFQGSELYLSSQWLKFANQQAQQLEGKYLLPQRRLIEFWQYVIETNLAIGALNSEYHTEVISQTDGEKFQLLTQVRFYQFLSQVPELQHWLQAQQLLDERKTSAWLTADSLTNNRKKPTNTKSKSAKSKVSAAFPSYSNFGSSEAELATKQEQYADLLGDPKLPADSILAELAISRSELTSSQLAIAKHNLNLALSLLVTEAKFWGVSEIFVPEATEAYPNYSLAGYQILHPNNFYFLPASFLPSFAVQNYLQLHPQPATKLFVTPPVPQAAVSKLTSEQRQLQYQQLLEAGLAKLFPSYFVATMDSSLTGLTSSTQSLQFALSTESESEPVVKGMLLDFDPYWAKFAQNQTGFIELEQFLTDLVIKQRKFKQVNTKPRLVYLEHSLDFITQSLPIEFTGLNFQQLSDTYYQALLADFVTKQPLSEQQLLNFFTLSKEAFLQSQQDLTTWLKQNPSPLSNLIRAGREYQSLLELYGTELRSLCHRLKDLGNQLDLQIILNLNLYELSKRVGLRGVQLWKLLDLSRYNSFRIQTNSIESPTNSELLPLANAQELSLSASLTDDSALALQLNQQKLLQVDYRDLNFLQQHLPELYADVLTNVWEPAYWQRLGYLYPQKLISQAHCEISIRGLVAKQQTSKIPNLQAKVVPEQLAFNLRYFIFSKQMLLSWH